MGFWHDVRLGLVLGVVGAAALSVTGCVVVVHDNDDDWDSEVSYEKPKRIGVETAQPGPTLADQLALDRHKSCVITRVVAGSPAERAGLQKHDVIVAINGDHDADEDDLRRAIRSSETGDELRLDIIRSGQPMQVVVMLEPHGWNRPTMTP